MSVIINNDLTRLGTTHFRHSSTSCAIFLTGLRATLAVLVGLRGVGLPVVGDPCPLMLWVTDWTVCEADAV